LTVTAYQTFSPLSCPPAPESKGKSAIFDGSPFPSKSLSAISLELNSPSQRPTTCCLEEGLHRVMNGAQETSGVVVA
jgi:hypothetical protein